jgi:DNA-binding NarL/FixJ family response regulator
LNNQPINIAVLESSQIVFEGIENILSKSGKYFKIFRIDNLNEIEKNFPVEKLDAIIVNPLKIQNKEKEFLSVKRNCPNSCWIALIYSYIDQNLLSMFDKTIQISDSPETIIEIVNKAAKATGSISQNPEQEQLSDRELDVLKLIVSGLSNKEIADKLFISIHTVISHRKNISQKTGIKSQSGLTIYAISNKIIQIEDYQN